MTTIRSRHSPGRRAFVSALARGSLLGAVGLPTLLTACSQPAPPAATPTNPPVSAAAPTATVPPPATLAPPTSMPAPTPAASSTPGATNTDSRRVSASGSVNLPTFVAIQGPTPDLPGSPDGLAWAPGYTRYPSNLFKSVSDTLVGNGETISIICNTSGVVPAPVEQNAAWQAIQKALGVTIELTPIPFADFPAKIPTIMAGSDLPDILGVLTRIDIPLLPEFFDAQAADLTPYLGGDAVKEYPNLANLPTRSWLQTIYSNKIYGVPIPLPPYFWWLWYHQDLLDQTGDQPPTSADDLKKLLIEFTRPADDLYGIGYQSGAQAALGMNNGLWPSIFKAPNNWSVDSSGAFTHMFESQGYRAGMAYARELWANNVYHPKSLTYNTVAARTDFQARKFAFRFDGLVDWSTGTQPTPPNKILMALPFAFDGGTPSYFYGRAAFGIGIVKKGSPERVKTILRVLNYLAAPFGSEEYELITYGVRGTDFIPDDKGNPKLTDRGKADTMPWNQIVGTPPVLYSPNDPSMPASYQGYEKAMNAVGVEDPTLGLFSRTDARRGAQILQPLADGVVDIITGRRQLADYDGLLSDWLSAGGNDVKQEYAQAYAAAKGA